MTTAEERIKQAFENCRVAPFRWWKNLDNLEKKVLQILAEEFVVVSRKELEELYKLPFTSQGQKSVPTLHDFVGKLLDMESKLRK